MFKKLQTSIVPSTQCNIFSFMKIDNIALLPIFWYFSITDLMELISSAITFIYSSPPAITISLTTLEVPAALPDFNFFTLSHTMPTVIWEQDQQVDVQLINYSYPNQTPDSKVNYNILSRKYFWHWCQNTTYHCHLKHTSLTTSLAILKICFSKLLRFFTKVHLYFWIL